MKFIFLRFGFIAVSISSSKRALGGQQARRRTADFPKTSSFHKISTTTHPAPLPSSVYKRSPGDGGQRCSVGLARSSPSNLRLAPSLRRPLHHLAPTPARPCAWLHLVENSRHRKAHRKTSDQNNWLFLSFSPPTEKPPRQHHPQSVPRPARCVPMRGPVPADFLVSAFPIRDGTFGPNTRKPSATPCEISHRTRRCYGEE